eukprot:PhF_6_TR5684/c0_g1_i1/m.8380
MILSVPVTKITITLEAASALVVAEYTLCVRPGRNLDELSHVPFRGNSTFITLLDVSIEGQHIEEKFYVIKPTQVEIDRQAFPRIDTHHVRLLMRAPFVLEGVDQPTAIRKTRDGRGMYFIDDAVIQRVPPESDHVPLSLSKLLYYYENPQLRTVVTTIRCSPGTWKHARIRRT